MQAMIADITKDNFQEVVLQNSTQLPVLIDFWSPNCPACSQILPQLEALAQKWAGRFILAKINTESQSELADQFQIKSIPSFKIIHHGKLIGDFQGAEALKDIKATLEPILKPDESETLRLQAQEAFHQKDYDQVIALLAQAAQANPNNYRVHLDLIKMYLHTGNLEQGQALFNKLPEEAQTSPEGRPLGMLMTFGKIVDQAAPLADIQAALQANPNDCDALYGVTGYLMINHAYEDAMKMLLKLFMTQRDYQDGIAQKTLIQIFEALQESHPQLVNTYRRQLQNQLF